MRQHASNLASRLCEHPGNFQQLGGFGFDTAAMVVGVNFDQHLERHAMIAPVDGDGACRLHAVGQDLQVTPLLQQGERLAKFAGSHADCIEDVIDPGREKLLRFLQCRYGDSLCAGVDLRPGHFEALRRLDVGPEPHAQRIHL